MRRVMDAAAVAHRGLGCSGVTRVDFIVAGDGTPFILEVNTLPGMTATSLVPKIAAGLGLAFPDLLRPHPRRRRAQGLDGAGAERRVHCARSTAGTSNRKT